LVEFVAQVYRVDVVAFQVGEHDDLTALAEHGCETSAIGHALRTARRTRDEAHEEYHREEERRGHEDREQE
jgi:hypothetical protein